MGSIDITITIKKKRRSESAAVPKDLLQRIDGCKSLTELLQLLFSTTQKTESVLAAFDAKIEALEKEGQTLSLHPLNSTNNGSTEASAVA